MSEALLCRGGSNDNECDCEEYQPPENVPPGQKAACTECLHGKSKHPKPGLVVTAAPELRATTGNQEVLRIFNASSRGGKENNAELFETARAEVLEGYRPASAGGSGKTKKKVSFVTVHDSKDG